ncbi:MAG: ATP-binding cassette domain-containing protein [Nitrospinae bacterium]|nr:ATP-binding cassette domain-containing protein [Nitrospinota bacterium]
MIEVENLTKKYGDARGINDVTFTVEKGEVLGFLGPNGAGKTTTMRILTCFMPATSGKAKIAGFDVFEDSLEVRKRIGYLPESVPLYTDMQVPVYLEFVAGLKGVDRRDVKRRVSHVMDDCALNAVSKKYIGELSKGYRQRVGLAQALINDPEVLILDEPTIGLDPRQIIEIRSLIKSLGGRRTVILSTHILPEVSMICQRVVIINEGRLVAVDTPQNLTAQLQRSQQILIRVGGPEKEVLSEVGKINGVSRVSVKENGADNINAYLIELKKDMVDAGKDIPPVIVRKNWSLHEMRPVGMSLEDIFIKLVTEEKIN